MKKIKEGQIKCVIWDLDNTLWNGTLLENDDVSLRPMVKETIETLDKRGILQSIASKNNHDDAIKKLKEFGLDAYFLYPQIHWDLKSNSIKKIQESFNFGMDTIAFIDDQEFERDEVNFIHADLNCYSHEVVTQILDLPEFMPRFITDESAKRRQLYSNDIKRNIDEEQFENNHKFLESLNLHFIISEASIADLQRVEELTVRTNQLNATGYTYSYDELLKLLTSPNHKIYVAELQDKYGTYGKIGVAMLEINDNKWGLKLLLMSCRVMSRGVGNVLLSYIINKAIENKAKLEGDFLPTDRNRLMYMTYKFAGFQEAEKLENGGVKFKHKLSEKAVYPSYIKLDIKSAESTNISKL